MEQDLTRLSASLDLAETLFVQAIAFSFQFVSLAFFIQVEESKNKLDLTYIVYIVVFKCALCTTLHLLLL